MKGFTKRLVAVATVLATIAFAPATTPEVAVTDVADGVDVVQLDASVITSPNVTYLGTLPIDSPGVGGTVRTHAVTGQRLFYATGLKGLTIYDVSDPALPVPVGVLPFPHSQNEDVSVSADGTRVIISADGALLLPIMPQSRGIHVVDATDPANPVMVATHPDSNHTTECADPSCDWLYGSSTAGIYDATRADEGIITRVEDRNWNEYTDADGNPAATTGRHAANVDEAGLVITDSTPRLVLDPRPHTGADGVEYGPANPEVLAVGTPNRATDNRLQHNNWRPNATRWEPRDPAVEADRFEDLVDGQEPQPQSLPEGSLRAGEVMIANSESNLNPQCSMAGGLSTWDLRDFDKGRAPVELDVFRPVSGTWAEGNPAVNGLGCSGHWFTVNPVSDTTAHVTASWYEHGVRFFEVGLDTGKITEVGFFQPVATEAGAAIWIDDQHVYSVDYARGIDILRFDAEAPRPTEQERVDAWLLSLGRVGELASRERAYCQLAVAD